MIDGLIDMTRLMGGSDLHITVGEPPCVRVHGAVRRIPDKAALTPADVDALARELTRANKLEYSESKLDYDFCYVNGKQERQRVNIFTQKGARGIVLRMLNSKIPNIEDLNLPEIFKDIASFPRGLVLVTGPTGSGKTTTLAAMVDYINKNRSDHILTIEDPIEYLHTGSKCVVNQREVGVDVDNFSVALRAALREDPDVILVGEMRDLETISAAITAAETGHFVMGTLHTIGAAKTIDRVIDVFPPHQQQQVRVQLATVLKAVITQTLLPKADGGGRVPAFEILLVNDAVSNLIREGKTFQINSIIQTNQKNGMILLDTHLSMLCKQGLITREAALDRCTSKEEFLRLMP
jgi:twitching motility protein PilT